MNKKYNFDIFSNRNVIQYCRFILVFALMFWLDPANVWVYAVFSHIFFGICYMFFRKNGLTVTERTDSRHCLETTAISAVRHGAENTGNMPLRTSFTVCHRQLLREISASGTSE